MIKNIFISCFFMLCLISCSANRINYRHYETTNYCISNSHIENNKYLTTNGTICEVPFLPSGLYLTCNGKMNVTIDYQKRNDDIDVYPIHNVRKVYENGNFLIINTDVEIILIEKNNPYNTSRDYNVALNDSNLLFDADYVELEYCNSYIQDALSLQDKRKNKKCNVDFSTPVINGIVRIGLYDNKFYFGQTIYSYFVLDLKTDEILFFMDKAEYDNYCRNAIDHSVEILEAKYLYD